MPSAPLGSEIPLRRLCPNKELFSLPPKVFGCVAYVQDLNPSLDKLAPRSLRCVFVGYSRTQKGYKCYHPPNRRYVVSADVTLFESTLHFDSVDSPPDSIPLPPPIADSTTDNDSSPVVEQNLSCPL